MKQMRSLKYQLGFWGALISAGVSLYASGKSSSAASSMDRMAMEQLAFDREQAELDNAFRDQMMGYLPDAFENEQAMQDYIMRQNDINRGLLMDQLTYSRDFTERNFGLLGQEQDYEKYRITQADRLAAEERSRQLQKLIDDEQTSAAERERALEELSYTRAIAAGERAYDVRAYEADQMTQELEYQYRVREYERSVGIANEERQFEIDRQEKILRQAGIMKDTIEEQLAGFGPLQHPERYDAEDVNEYTEEFYEAFRGDADRAANRLSSVNEAGLIRQGVDISSTGDSSRRRLLQEQLLPLYETARVNARTQAVGYVNNLQNVEVGGFNADVAARAATMGEALMGDGALLAIMKEMGIPISANQVDWDGIGTGIVAPRQLASAGLYNAPLAINSSIVNGNITAPGMDATRSLTTAANLAPSNVDASYSFATPDYLSPTDLMKILTASGYKSDGSAFNTLAAGATAAGSDATKNLLDAGNNFASFLDQWKPNG